MSQKRIKNRARNRAAKRKRRQKIAQNLHEKTAEARRMPSSANGSVDQKLKVRQAEEEPRPAPTARGYFVAKMWENLKLGQALEQVGIYKDSGVPMSTIFMVVIMMGIMGATSLNRSLPSISKKIKQYQIISLFKIHIIILFI